MTSSMINSLKHIYQFRAFIAGNVKRDFQARYRNSLLGSLWTILSPLATIAIYILVFSKLMKARLVGVDDTLAYSVYLCAGILTWGMFTEVISNAQNMFLQNANLLKKLHFPRLCLPVVVMFGSIINLAVVLTLFSIFLFYTDRWPGIYVIGIFPVILLQLIFAISLGLLFGILNVFFRDMIHFTGILLQFWFWFTPIIYPITILPDFLQRIVLMNPMTPIISSYQNVFVYNQWPDWEGLLIPIVCTTFIIIITTFFYRAHANDMVDEL